MVKLLIVDDDVKFSKQLKQALEQNGYTCFVLNSPTGVIETIKKEKIPVVFLDVMMPRVSGFELCRQIRINREVYNTGIIFLTAMNDPEEVEHGFCQGGDDYLVKPISFSLLLSRLNTLVSSLEHTPLTDTYTGVGTARYIRLELQRTILLRQPCGFAYIELSGIHSLQSLVAPNEVQKILSTFVRHIKTVSTAYYGKDFQLGHIGNGHFMEIIPQKNIETFLKDLKKSWDDLLPELYANYQLLEDKNKKENLLRTYICGLFYNPLEKMSVKSAFEALRQLYLQCKSQPNNEILIDRRKTPSKL